jgi:hypothetical protein
MKRKISVLCISTLILLFVFTTCENDSNKSVFNPAIIAGNYSALACYWKNGTRTALTMNAAARSSAVSGVKSAAKDIFISGTDEYIGGWITDANEYTYACYWKNGEITLLPHEDYVFNNYAANSSHVEAIYIIGTDVYAAGQLNYNGGKDNQDANYERACYWKNGEITVIEDFDSLSVTNSHFSNPYFTDSSFHITDIAIEETDVYIVGYADVGHSGRVNDSVFFGIPQKAVYYKNGEITLLDDNDALSSGVSSIVISGADEYIAGWITASDQNTYACYWKNGVITELLLPKSAHYSEARAMVVSGTNVYIVGNYRTSDFGDMDIACYWKNGEMTELTTPQDTSLPDWMNGGVGQSRASSIAIDGTDVYITGEWTIWKEIDDGYGGYMAACYWVNEKHVKLHTEKSTAEAVAILE